MRRGQLERAACAKLGVFERLDREPADVCPDETWLDAYGAARLIDSGTVAASMPAGAAIFEGRDPSCTVVTEVVEYSCTLDRPPAPEVQDFKGTAEPTVDATKHVNGGCRSLDSAGLHWECFLGQKAVDEQIITQDFLGDYAPGPGHG